MEEEAADLAIRAKEAAHANDFEEAVNLFQMSYDLHPTEKVKRRMEKLKEFIRQQEEEEEEEEEDDGMVNMGHGFFLHESIATNLYEYQKEGVLWFWRLFKKKAGGILGDDMGLGKTIQVIAFLAGMFDAELIRNVIIVAPLAVLVNWENEFKKWAGGIRVKTFHGTKIKERINNLRKIQRSKGVLLTTYGMLLSNHDSLCLDKNEESFVWDYLILDEGHKIKNATKTSKCVRSVHSRYNYILSGTPIQNNLGEMWSLFDFAMKGNLLGTKKTFEIEFQKPIVRAREKDADSYSQQVGNKMSEKLREIIQPYFLRRTKDDVFKKKDKIDMTSLQEAVKNIDNDDANKLMKNVPHMVAVKNDLVIWVYLSPLQLKIYKRLAHSERVKEVIMTTRSPLAELTLLKKICDHPQLQSTLSKLLTRDETLDGRIQSEVDDGCNDEENSEPIAEAAAHAPPVDELINASGKMIFLVFLMQKLKEENHRTLIFSQSRKMLDIIQKVLLSLDHKILRIDGTISNPQQREKILNTFHDDVSYNVLLMTTQIGSVGLNMTTADRLIIFDPSWNPGTDAQAVDRIYRLGQTKNVVVYRLISCGTIEEKIYRKQIFKNAVMKQTTGSSFNPYRYFTNQQLRELFVLDDPTFSNTQLQLQEMHPYVKADPILKDHLKFLNDGGYIFGVSHHDQLFSKEAEDDKEFTSQEIIDAHVTQASKRVTQEHNTDFAMKEKRKEQVDHIKPLPSFSPQVIMVPSEDCSDDEKVTCRSPTFISPPEEVISIDDDPVFNTSPNVSTKDSSSSSTRESCGINNRSLSHSNNMKGRKNDSASLNDSSVDANDTVLCSSNTQLENSNESVLQSDNLSWSKDKSLLYPPVELIETNEYHLLSSEIADISHTPGSPNKNNPDYIKDEKPAEGNHRAERSTEIIPSESASEIIFAHDSFDDTKEYIDVSLSPEKVGDVSSNYGNSFIDDTNLDESNLCGDSSPVINLKSESSDNIGIELDKRNSLKIENTEFQSPWADKSNISSSIICSLGKSYRTPPAHNPNSRLILEVDLSHKKTSTPVNCTDFVHSSRKNSALLGSTIDSEGSINRNKVKYLDEKTTELCNNNVSKPLSLDLSNIHNAEKQLHSMVVDSDELDAGESKVSLLSDTGDNMGDESENISCDSRANVSSHSIVSSLEKVNNQVISNSRCYIGSDEISIDASGDLYESLVDTCNAATSMVNELKSDDHKSNADTNSDIILLDQPQWLSSRALELKKSSECDLAKNTESFQKGKHNSDKSLTAIGNVSRLTYECCDYGGSPIPNENHYRNAKNVPIKHLSNSDHLSQNVSLKRESYYEAREVSCSPISHSFIANNHTNSVKSMNTSGVSYDSSKISLNCEAGSSVKSLSVNSSGGQFSSNQLADTIPVDKSNSQFSFFAKSTIDKVNYPIFTESLVNKKDSYQSTATSLDSSHYDDTAPFCSQVSSEASDYSNFDVARLEKMRKDSENKRCDSKLNGSKACISDGEELNGKILLNNKNARSNSKVRSPNVSNISNLLKKSSGSSCRKKAEKPSSHEVSIVDNCESSNNTSKDNLSDFNERFIDKDLDQEDKDHFRVQKLKQLEYLLEKNMNGTLDDHVLMEIGELVKELNIGCVR